MIAFVYLVFWIQIWSWCILGTSSFQSYKLHATTPSATSLWVRHVVQMSSTPSTSIESTPFVRRRNRVGIDYGPRFIGIAWSDFFGNVQTHAMLSNSGNLTDIALKILSVARSYAAAEIVLGIPIDPVGQLNYDIKSFNGQLCLNFSKVLSAVVNHETKQRMKVMLFDERYTTKEAKIKLAMSKTKASIDAMSALCLLERYLEDQGEGSIEAIPCEYPPSREHAIFDYDIVRKHIYEVYYSDSNNGLGEPDLPKIKKSQTLESTGLSKWDIGVPFSSSRQKATGLSDEDMSDLSEEEKQMLEERAKRRKKGTLKNKPQL